MLCSGPHAPLQVLFLHGLESGPRGVKVRALRKQGHIGEGQAPHGRRSHAGG
jgi:hypothetical protein